MLLPSYAELPDGASWGAWPGNEVYGTLNLLTPDRAVAAAQLVQSGETFAMNLDMELPDPPLFGRGAFEHKIVVGRRIATTYCSTGTRSPRRNGTGCATSSTRPRGNYGGIPDEAHGIHFWARKGIVGRGVLLDVGRWRAEQGRPLRLDYADAIELSDLDGCLEAQGVTLEPGDVLLMHTGWVDWYRSLDADGRAALAENPATPGIRAGRASAAWLWDHHIAAIVGDNPAVELMPFAPELSVEKRRAGWADVENRGELFGHIHFIPMLGIPLGEMFDLGPLAAACALDRRYTCLFASAPVNLLRGVASPPNALAIR